MTFKSCLVKMPPNCLIQKKSKTALALPDSKSTLIFNLTFAKFLCYPNLALFGKEATLLERCNL